LCGREAPREEFATALHFCCVVNSRDEFKTRSVDGTVCRKFPLFDRTVINGWSALQASKRANCLPPETHQRHGRQSVKSLCSMPKFEPERQSVIAWWKGLVQCRRVEIGSRTPLEGCAIGNTDCFADARDAHFSSRTEKYSMFITTEPTMGIVFDDGDIWRWKSTAYSREISWESEVVDGDDGVNIRQRDVGGNLQVVANRVKVGFGADGTERSQNISTD
jgi:hypothetical protein